MSADCESVVSPSLSSEPLPHHLTLPSNPIRNERSSHPGISYEGRVSLISPLNSYEATVRAAFSLDHPSNSLPSPHIPSPPLESNQNHSQISQGGLHFPFHEEHGRSVLSIQPQIHSTPGSSRDYNSYEHYRVDRLYDNLHIKQENTDPPYQSYGNDIPVSGIATVLSEKGNDNNHFAVTDTQSRSEGTPETLSDTKTKLRHTFSDLSKNTLSHSLIPAESPVNEKDSNDNNSSEPGSPSHLYQDNEDRPCSPDSDHPFSRESENYPAAFINAYLETTQETINHGENSKSIKCQFCSYSTDSKSEFSSHLNSHFDHKCMKCEFTTQTIEQLKDHLREEHGLAPEDVEDLESSRVPRINSQGKVKTFKCKQCGYIAITKSDFWEHAKTHIKSEKLLACTKCPFVTEYKHHLEYHMRNHFGSKPYKCNKCSYSCVNKSMLNSHMKSHSNIYQYRCSDCTYATKYCHSLKLHLRKYGHTPAMVLNPDGTPNPVPIIDIYGTRRGPKLKKDENGMPILPPQYQLQAQFVRAHMEVTGTIPPAPTVPLDKYGGKSNPVGVNLPPPPQPSFPNPFTFQGNSQNFPSFIPHEFIETSDKEKQNDNTENTNEQGDKEEKLNVSKSPEVQESFKCEICSFSAQNKDILTHHMLLHAKEKEDFQQEPKPTETAAETAKTTTTTTAAPLIHESEITNLDIHEPPSQSSQKFTNDQTKYTQQSFPPNLSVAQNSLHEYFARAINPLLYPPIISGQNFVHPAFEFQQQLQRLVYRNTKDQNFTKVLNLSPIKPALGRSETVLDLSKEQTPPGDTTSSQPHSSTSPSFLTASPPNTDVSTPPSKNRRKGRAFKLERIALRLSGSGEEGENSSNEGVDNQKDNEKRSKVSEIPPLLPLTGQETQTEQTVGLNGRWKEAYQCQYCDIAFKDGVMYTMHMGYHGYKNPFTCNMCGYDAEDKLAFFLHIGRSSHL